MGPELLVERLDLAPGMRVLDSGCGPERLTIPLARAVGAGGERSSPSTASVRCMLEKLEKRAADECFERLRILTAEQPSPESLAL